MKKKLALYLAVLMLMAIPLTRSEGGEYLPAPENALSFGDKGTVVLRLQTRLQELLYYSGPLSGEYGDITRRAVKAVQEAYGLPATGNANENTLAVIYSECYRPLSYDSSGEDVKRLQRRLTELAYYHGLISGNYWDGTTAAIGHFQNDAGLAKTGKADVKTQELLFSGGLFTPAATPIPVQTPVITASLTVVPTAFPTPFPGDPETNKIPASSLQPAVPYQGKLDYGSTGSRVALLQERLKALGYYSGKISSGFYNQTQKALKAFQKQNGLVQDGVAGRQTWEALFSTGAISPQETAKPTAAPTPVPYFIEVDVNNQLITVFARSDSGEYNIPVKRFICSTGTTSYPSDLGVFTLNGRKALWANFPAWGGGYARYWVRINSSIAFHSVIYNTANTMDLNIASYNSLGKRASHGCIRLTVAGAKWIYDNIGAGVKVRIHQNAVRDPEFAYTFKPGPVNPSNMLPYAASAPTAPPVYDGTRIPGTSLRTLSVGSSGEDVHWLQSKLKELGYYHGTVTGQYREGTRDAVKAYQRANSLTADGYAGPKTLTHLYQSVLASAAYDLPAVDAVSSFSTAVSFIPVPTPSSAPIWTVDED